jgi:Choline/Carnitine o-acyltransferase
MYCVAVKAGDRGRLSEDEIASQLLHILSDAPCLPVKPPPIGLLTAQDRHTWAKDREILLKGITFIFCFSFFILVDPRPFQMTPTVATSN